MCGGKAPGEELARAECRNAVPGTLGRLGSAVGLQAGLDWAGAGVRSEAQGVARKRTTDDGQPATAVKTGICSSISKWT